MQTIFATILVVVILGAGFGCGTEENITYENQTGLSVQLFLNGRFVDTIPAGESINRRSRDGDHEIRAVADDGEAIFEKTFTWEELKDLNFVVEMK